MDAWPPAIVEHRCGDILLAQTEAVVNPVNAVGVMGRGLALQIREHFPANYAAYREACEKGEVKSGRMFVFETGQMWPPRLIVNFPTKRHWRDAARLEDIESGLRDLVRVIRAHDVRTIAVPALGCGNGGLEWREVAPLISAALSPLSGLRATVYDPSQ